MGFYNKIQPINQEQREGLLTKPRILFLDIETSLLLAYTFGIRDQHIQHTQIADDRGGKLIHCVGLKWRGKKPFVLSEWEHGYEGMMHGVHKALCEADAVATYNGARFDLPKIQGQFALLNMDPPPPPTQIDLFKTARRMGYVSSKLDYLAQLLGVGSKVKHPGMSLWIDVFNECPKAQNLMSRYCAGDVRLTERVYDRLLPYVPNHPHLHEGAPCGTCGSKNTQRRGTSKSKYYKTERIFCNDCRGWSTGKRSKIVSVA